MPTLIFIFINLATMCCWSVVDPAIDACQYTFITPRLSAIFYSHLFSKSIFLLIATSNLKISFAKPI